MAASFRRPRAAIDLSRSQLADLQAGTVAGENVYHGIDGQTLLRMLEGSAHERELVAAALEQLRDQLRAHELMQERRDRIDVEARAERQGNLDATLEELRALAAAHAYEQRVIRRWLGALTVAGVVFVALLVVAYLYRLPPFDPAAMLRLAIGGGLALPVQFWRML